MPELTEDQSALRVQANDDEPAKVVKNAKEAFFTFTARGGQHERINAQHYPGTRQICVHCDEPTERCEEDSFYTDAGAGPLCKDCYYIASPLIEGEPDE